MNPSRNYCEGSLGAPLQQHKFVGEWCPANRWKEDEKKLKVLKYRCKAKHAKLYEQISIIHNTYTDVWNL
jgi:hypothetical protein